MGRAIICAAWPVNLGLPAAVVVSFWGIGVGRNGSVNKQHYSSSRDEFPFPDVVAVSF